MVAIHRVRTNITTEALLPCRPSPLFSCRDQMNHRAILQPLPHALPPPHQQLDPPQGRSAPNPVSPVIQRPRPDRSRSREHDRPAGGGWTGSGLVRSYPRRSSPASALDRRAALAKRRSHTHTHRQTDRQTDRQTVEQRGELDGHTRK